MLSHLIHKTTLQVEHPDPYLKAWRGYGAHQKFRQLTNDRAESQKLACQTPECEAFPPVCVAGTAYIIGSRLHTPPSSPPPHNCD